MSTYTIPEEIIGLPLFVPPGNDYFSIEDGGLPNGDDCLIVQGAVSRSYKAFQAAPTLSPNLFLSRNTNEWSVSFWFKCAATGTPTDITGQPMKNNVIFGVQTIEGVNSYSALNSTWLVCAQNQGGVARLSLWANDGGGNAMTNVCRDGNWHLVVFTVSTGGSGAMDGYVDLDASPPAGLSANKGGTVAMTEPYFCIGAYGNHANSLGYDQQFRIAKLAFHDHKLTRAERASLFSDMWETVSPSSPLVGSTNQIGSTDRITLTLPGGWAAGDYAVAFVSLFDNVAASNYSASGWTLVAPTLGASSTRSNIFVRELQGGDSNPIFIYPGGGSNYHAGVILVYPNGMGVVDPIEQIYTTGSTENTPASRTSIVKNSRILSFMQVDFYQPIALKVGSEQGFTAQASLQISGQGGFVIADKVVAVPGSVTMPTYTCTTPGAQFMLHKGIELYAAA